MVKMHRPQPKGKLLGIPSCMWRVSGWASRLDGVVEGQSPLISSTTSPSS